MIKISGKSNIKKLFSELGINYITEYVINYKDILNKDCYNSTYYLNNKEEFNNLTEKYDVAIRNRNTANIYIGKSENKGYGLFTNNKLSIGEFIGVYIGIIKEEDEYVEYDESGYDTDYAWDFPDKIEEFPDLEINAKYSGNEMRFANHDQEPNLRVEHTIVDNMWYIFFLADREILKNEELTISYGKAYWDTEYRTLS